MIVIGNSYEGKVTFHPLYSQMTRNGKRISDVHPSARLTGDIIVRTTSRDFKLQMDDNQVLENFEQSRDRDLEYKLISANIDVKYSKASLIFRSPDSAILEAFSYSVLYDDEFERSI